MAIESDIGFELYCMYIHTYIDTSIHMYIQTYILLS